MQHHFIIPTLLLIGLCALCCNEGATDLPLKSQLAFRDQRMSISADPEQAVTDRPITITTSCFPLLQGKGTMTLSVRGAYGDDTVYVLSPVVDTLHQPFNLTEDPLENRSQAEFTTMRSEELRTTWRIRLRQYPQNRVYNLSASVHLDSVFIADSNRMYGVEDSVVFRYYPYGVSAAASTPSTLTLNRP